MSAGLASSSGAVSGSTSAGGFRQLTLYAALADKQFINNGDDRARGAGNNPFGNSSNAAIAPTANEAALGPFPGDTGVFAFDLYTSADHAHTAGSAIFICQYSFNEDAACDAFFQLSGGAIVGKGTANFNVSKFTLAIVAGTSKYRGVKGRVDVSASGVATQEQPVARAVPMLQSQRLAFVTSPGAAAGHKLTVYTNPVEQDFVTNADDLSRGAVNNPFGKHETGLGSKKAPFPGDMAIYSFDVFADAGLKTKVGSAVISCYYAFNENAFCDASFQMNGGALIAAGAFNFNAKTFALAVSGGYGKYRDAAGDVQATPSGKRAQRFAFVLA